MIFRCLQLSLSRHGFLSLFSCNYSFLFVFFWYNCSTQVGSQPITSISWLPMLRVLVTVSKDGSLQVWKTRVIINPNRPSTQTNFFEPAGKPDDSYSGSTDEKCLFLLDLGTIIMIRFEKCEYAV